MTRSGMHRIGMVAAAALAVAVGTTMSADSPAHAAPQTSGTYYTTEPVCAAPAPGQAGCLAMRRVAHARSVPGSVPATALATPAALPAGPAGGYTPGDLAKAYGVNAGLATSQVVGIVDAYDDPNALSDLNAFDAQYGLPAETATSFKKINQTGGTTPPTANAGWAGEISLDLDAVRGLCHACKIVLVEATDNTYANLAVAENRAVTAGATVVSNSYGGPESGRPAASILNAYKHPGVVITASTADHGYFDWDHYNDSSASSSEAPTFPASDSTVVAVGGTTLQLADDGTRSSESVWNENELYDRLGYRAGIAYGASGGGCSTVFKANTWQSQAASYSQTACGTKRSTGDIAALADPYTGYDIYDSYQSSGWQTFGGTSLSAPLVAAMWALAGGSGGVTYPSQSLYQHLAASDGSLYDVTTGGNGFCDGGSPAQCAAYWGGSPNTFGSGTLDCAWKADSAARSAGTRECDAAPGFDGPSGVGTPVGLTAFRPVS